MAGANKPARHPLAHKIHLRRPVDHIADLLPVFQILAVHDRHTREIGKGRIDQIVIRPHLHDARIGIKARSGSG